MADTVAMSGRKMRILIWNIHGWRDKDCALCAADITQYIKGKVQGDWPWCCALFEVKIQPTTVHGDKLITVYYGEGRDKRKELIRLGVSDNDEDIQSRICDALGLDRATSQPLTLRRESDARIFNSFASLADQGKANNIGGKYEVVPSSKSHLGGPVCGTPPLCASAGRPLTLTSSFVEKSQLNTLLKECAAGSNRFAPALDPTFGSICFSGLQSLPLASFDVQCGSEEKRVALICEFDNLLIYALHLDDRNEETRIAQLDKVLLSEKGRERPIVLLGDFNALNKDDYTDEYVDKLRAVRAERKIAPPEFAFCERLTAEGFVDLFRLLNPALKDASLQTSTHGVRVDHIWVNQPFLDLLNLESSRVTVEHNIHYSDHYPVCIDLHFEKE